MGNSAFMYMGTRPLWGSLSERPSREMETDDGGGDTVTLGQRDTRLAPVSIQIGNIWKYSHLPAPFKLGRVDLPCK